MRLAVFNDFRLGAVVDDVIHDLTPVLPGWRSDDPAFVNTVIGHLPPLRPAIDALVERDHPLPLSEVQLRAPVPRPGQLLAAPLNFREHRAEMTGPLTAGPGTAAELGFFVKASGSISGPADEVWLPPIPDRRFDFEGEIAVVIGRRAAGVPADAVLQYVAGYTLLLDMTMRMTDTDREERTLRKSFATFAPIGPWITTADEIPDPSRLGVRVWLNGDLRQDASLADLIVDVPELLARASSVVPLDPGDIYTTGSPAGVGQVRVGDTILVESEPIGRMKVRVAERPW